MKYYLKLVMEGDFPGSPDTESREVSESFYNYLYSTYFRNRRNNEL
jgi:hypothetical protein